MTNILLISGFLLYLIGSIMVCNKEKFPNWHLIYFVLPFWVIILAINNFRYHKTWSIITIAGTSFVLISLLV
jgi:hypothetical protein